jgi:leucyl aminopeptidase (aminopeptidase T)
MQMASTANILKKLMEPGSEIHLSTGEGTDLHLKLANHATRINCGRCLENQNPFGPSMAFLPAGEVYTCIDPQSANGTVVIPSMGFRGKKVTNLKLEIKDGHITEINAEKNANLIKELLEKSSKQAGILSVIDLGINPDSHPLEGADFYSWEMAGLVTLTTGGNTWAGGDIVSDAGLTFHIADSDLSANGTQVILGGELMINQQAGF